MNYNSNEDNLNHELISMMLKAAFDSKEDLEMDLEELFDKLQKNKPPLEKRVREKHKH